MIQNLIYILKKFNSLFFLFSSSSLLTKKTTRMSEDKKIKELEQRLLKLKHKRSRLSLYPPIKLEKEEHVINLLTNTELEFKLEINGFSVDSGMYLAKFSCEDEPGEEVFLKVNENNEITEIIISHREYYEWSDWNESYVYTNRDTKCDIKFKKV